MNNEINTPYLARFFGYLALYTPLVVMQQKIRQLTLLSYPVKGII